MWVTCVYYLSTKIMIKLDVGNCCPAAIERGRLVLSWEKCMEESNKKNKCPWTFSLDLNEVNNFFKVTG